MEDNLKDTEFELLKNLYPEKFREFVRPYIEETQYVKERLALANYYIDRLYKLISAVAQENEGRDWFIDTGSIWNVLDYFLEHPDSWLANQKLKRKLKKKNRVFPRIFRTFLTNHKK